MQTGLGISGPGPCFPPWQGSRKMDAALGAAKERGCWSLLPHLTPPSQSWPVLTSAASMARLSIPSPLPTLSVQHPEGAEKGPKSSKQPSRPPTGAERPNIWAVT